MKKKLLAILIAGACSTPTIASAATTYVGANVGLGFVNNSNAIVGGVTVNDVISYKTGIPIGAAIGLKGEEYRVEFALNYQINSADKILTTAAASNDKVSMLTYMANAYYDFSFDKNISPYVTAGLGAASINPKGDNLAGASKTVFAWQLGTGVGIKAGDNIVVDLGYRYVKPSSYTVTNPYYNAPVKFTTASSNILLGLRYSF